MIKVSWKWVLYVFSRRENRLPKGMLVMSTFKFEMEKEMRMVAIKKKIFVVFSFLQSIWNSHSRWRWRNIPNYLTEVHGIVHSLLVVNVTFSKCFLFWKKLFSLPIIAAHAAQFSWEKKIIYTFFFFILYLFDYLEFCVVHWKIKCWKKT